jgi:hypothetical protein
METIIPRIIGLNGYKRSGKDTTGALIRRFYDNNTVKAVAFADRVKIFAARSLGYEGSGVDLVNLMNSLKEYGFVQEYTETNEKYVNGRDFICNVGDTGRRMFGLDFWVDQVLPKPLEHHPSRDVRMVQASKELDIMYPGIQVLVVTDVRYPNEAERVLRLGGEVWNVQRPGVVSDGKATEQPLDPSLITAHITNDSDLESLQERVGVLLGNEARLP